MTLLTATSSWQALGLGKTAQELKAEGSPDFQTPFRITEGNRPINMVLAEKLDPATLGSLEALYELEAV